MSDPIAFAEAQLEEDGRIAMGACGIGWPRVTPEMPEHWHWECCDDDAPLDVDLAIAGGEEFLQHGDEHYRVGLRSVEEYPSCSMVGPLAHLVIDGEEVHPRDARHIARHDPARAFREVEAGRRILARHRECPVQNGYCERWTGPEVCPEMADLLYRWADRPGYNPAWKP